MNIPGRCLELLIGEPALTKLAYRIIYFACSCLLLFGPVVVRAQEPAKAAPEKSAFTAPANVDQKAVPRQKIVEQGIAIEFTIDPLREKSTELMAGEEAIVRFKVTDTTTGTPVKGLNLSAWMSLRAGGAADPEQCREKILSYVQGSMRARPEVDLNSYYVLSLNESPDISVIDPLLSFGGRKLLTLVMLRSPGEDWVLSGDGERLFVTLPLINQLAVIDTRSWTVKAYIETGVKPTRLALQPDQKYLWVANDGLGVESSGVTVIDAATLKVAAQISTGAGHHEIVITSDSRFVFVSNQESGTLSVIDVGKLAQIKEVKIGATPVSMALSVLSKAIYVVSETEGTITVIDEQSQKVLARMKGKPGLRSIRFAPGGRYGFALNARENTVHILDAAINRVLHDTRVGRSPDQIVFSERFAFIRSLGTESVAMIRLATIATDVETTEFPGGQMAPEKGSRPIRAASMALAPEGNSIIVANPVDKVLYYYTEGMAAPMGNFQNYRREPRAVLVVDRSLRETNPGVYSANVRLPASGKYDVAFLADSPRITYCFEAAAVRNPALKEAQPVALRIEYQTTAMKLEVGKDFPFRFKLVETTTNKSKDDLQDVQVLTFSGSWQRRDLANSLGNGVYEIKLNVPEAGIYIPDIEVLDQDGNRVNFYSDLTRGKTVAINFIFTTCTTICPPLAATFARVQKEMGDRVGRDVHFISISVDPVTDTPQRLKTWGAKFKGGAGWTLVTGDKQKIDKLLNALGALVARREDHSPTVIIGNDLTGEWMRTYGLAKPSQLVALILKVMKEKRDDSLPKEPHQR